MGGIAVGVAVVTLAYCLCNLSTGVPLIGQYLQRCYAFLGLLPIATVLNGFLFTMLKTSYEEGSHAGALGSSELYTLDVLPRVETRHSHVSIPRSFDCCRSRIRGPVILMASRERVHRACQLQLQ